jgi:uroporphyrinogen decarboxylase
LSERIELFKKVMKLEEVEEIPAIPSVSGWVAKTSGLPLPKLLFDAGAMANAHVKSQKEIGYDALFAYCDALYIPEAFGCPLVFRSSGPDVEPLEINCEEDVRSLPVPDCRRDGRLSVLLNLAEELARLPGREVPVLSLMEGPFTNCSRIMGAEKLMRALIKNRQVVERMLDKVYDLLSAFGRRLKEIPIDGLIIADPVSSSTMISPSRYREFVLPTLQSFIRNLGLPVILHVCGNTNPILDLMAETGARILSLDQCMDLVKAKETVAGRCGIGGNVDPVHVLLFGTPEDVRRETLRCLRQGGKKGYLLMAGCAVPPDTPVENLKAMVETARSFS